MVIKEYPSVERWFSHVFSSGIRSSSTEKTYIHFLERFCKYTGKNPDELIAERLEHLKADTEPERRQHEAILEKWRNYLEQEIGLARGTIVTGNNIIKSFYKANFVPLMIKSPKTWTTTVRKVPTPTELGLMIKKSRKARDKTIIICLAQSGISLEDFLELLTYGRIKEELNNGIEPLHIPMVREKVKKHYDTFLGTDALTHLRPYIQAGTPKPNDRLFTISKRAIEYIVKKASDRAGLKPHVTPHQLRKFFSTYMTLSFMSTNAKHIPIVDFWMGHVMPYAGAYLVPPVDLEEQVTQEGKERILSQREIYKAHEWAISIK